MKMFNSVAEFEEAFDDALLDDEYAEYILENCHGERVIGNGDALVQAMEQGYLYEAFQESRVREDHSLGA